MKVRAVLNPRAGLAARRALAALEQVRPSWGRVDVRVTEGPGHAVSLAREAAEAGCEVVLAAGGDGTANEVATGILGTGTRLGLVPVGSGNGLARTLGIPLDPARALEVLEAGRSVPIDVGLANGRPFLNVAGAGFDAVVGAAFHARGRAGGRRGILTYFQVGLANVSYRAPEWRLEVDGQRWEGRAFIVAFLNGRQYGAGAVVAPGARIDDGRVEVVVLGDAPRLVLLWNLPRLFLGTIQRFSGYSRLAGRRAVLEGPPLFPHHRDGEPEPAGGRLEVELRPRALEVLVPTETTEDPSGPFLDYRRESTTT